MTIRGLSCSQNILLSKQLTQESFSTLSRKCVNTITNVSTKIDVIEKGGGFLHSVEIKSNSKDA